MNSRRYMSIGRINCWTFLFGLLTLLFGCVSDADHESLEQKSTNAEIPLIDQLPSNEAGKIVRSAIRGAGGWDSWVSKKTLSYIKVMQFMDSTGSIKRELHQLHQYQLQPNIKVRISWEEAGDKYVIVNNGQQAWKLKNGKEQKEQSDIGHAWNSSFGSQYVMCMPFKLTDPGVVLTYEGLDTLAKGEIVHSIKVTYEEGAGSAAGMHTWWYYFDVDNFTPVANFLDYGDGYDFTRYEAFAEVDGIQLNKERESYHTDARRNLKYVTTRYRNEDIKFNVEMAEGLFEP